VVVIPFQFGSFKFEMEISVKARTEEHVSPAIGAGRAL
jgi:hypothetical protein